MKNVITFVITFCVKLIYLQLSAIHIKIISNKQKSPEISNFRAFWCYLGQKRYKNKKTQSFDWVFSWCAGRDSPSAAALRPCIPAWPRLGARLLQLKTVYHTVFLTLQPSRVLVPLSQKTKNPTPKRVSDLFGALEGTRTPDPLIRSQVLYPAELPAQSAILY